MKRGFYTIMSAQFCSSLADNALFVAAVELLRTNGSPEWQRAALVPMFALFYVVLAPFVGAFADAMPKGKVMFVSNAIKVVGCLMMLFGSHPLIAYAVVGLGAAAYSPAKYGILTELLPASQLVKANGWIEGLTIASIILGVLLGGQLVGPNISGWLLSVDLPFVDTGVDTAAEAAIATLIAVYLAAAWFNTRIPHTGVEMRPMPGNPLALLPDFWACNNRLWRDKLGQISLATTTLFWGAGGNLKFIVLAWAAAALAYNTTQASALTGVVAIGTAAGAIVASMRMRLDMATKVIPLGIAMGVLLILMVFIKSIWIAIPFLILLGGLGGYLVVPMNALLQHRGHNLMGAGRSIAVQNFNEQAAILGLGAFYSLSLKMGLSVFGAITAFGLVVAGVMWVIRRWHIHNCTRHHDEVEHLLHIARHDHHH
ncbi:lysophospholipid transporter LplT [Paracidovorax citrulli]|uniref:Major facilitator superfamily MFS_1 n=2 Tax=Paracidovorax citrulli TaxID=80869 RepID=A1TIS1_PARC0|nr:lysophospholipid transporter LplT [Paracidovorax citrulli]ABM30859.1 major facilitator superfamily MFS_1 [Paracidovorax citrulli AAC00-1]ATG95968.1 lysophospholipid transporter LplT [Paracidovorax citrulli]PVY65035.1 putative MFS family arabinose efflux permease [Paracidovorax citrulli]QCX10933.1 Lysophospholipid transporter LplT [Paracidovorax citrulli]REG70775.1 putative MFS family arabinose efflux permease [Paracidovorax citrulli]